MPAKKARQSVLIPVTKKGKEGLFEALENAPKQMSAKEKRQIEREANEKRLSELLAEAKPYFKLAREKGYSFSVIAETARAALDEPISTAAIRRILEEPKVDDPASDGETPEPEPALADPASERQKRKPK